MTTPQQPIPIAQPAAPIAPNTKPQNKRRNKKAFPRPENKITWTLPQPKILSTTTLTNDPLWLESFVLEGEHGLTNVKSIKEFEADAAGYIELVEQEYKAISDVDR